MKCRHDFVTNSSSSSYIIAVDGDWSDFINELKNITDDVDLGELEMLLSDRKEALTKQEARHILERHFTFCFSPLDFSRNMEDCKREGNEKANEMLERYFDALSNFSFFELGEFEDHVKGLESKLDRNEVLKENDKVRIWYMNHH